jgi:hypothetical protein
VALGIWLAGFGFVFEAGVLEGAVEGFVTVFCGTALVVFALVLGLTVDGLGFEAVGALPEFEAPDGARLIGVTATGGFGVAGVVGLV